MQFWHELIRLVQKCRQKALNNLFLKYRDMREIRQTYERMKSSEIIEKTCPYLV